MDRFTKVREILRKPRTPEVQLFRVMIDLGQDDEDGAVTICVMQTEDMSEAHIMALAQSKLNASVTIEEVTVVSQFLNGKEATA